MKIGIFEEYPCDENLSKLSYLKSPADLIIAAQNIRKFDDLTRQIRASSPNVKKLGYWPVLDKQDGYWISAFTKPTALNRVLNELAERADPKSPFFAMLDIETPFIFDKSQLIKRLSDYESNKRRINSFAKQYSNRGLDLITAEHNTTTVPEVVQKVLGLQIDSKQVNCERIRMVYTSLAKYLPKFLGDIPRGIEKQILKRESKKGLAKYGDKFYIGLGCIASGILGNEPSLTPKELAEDIQIVKEQGVNGIYIFRLGGINSEFAEAIESSK